jgi:hypothetical protein
MACKWWRLIPKFAVSFERGGCFTFYATAEISWGHWVSHVRISGKRIGIMRQGGAIEPINS